MQFTRWWGGPTSPRVRVHFYVRQLGPPPLPPCRAPPGAGAEQVHGRPAILTGMSTERGHRESDAAPLKGRVLVVDDEEAIRRLYGRWLSALGFEVVEAAGGTAAIDLYTTDAEGFDLVILDMIMPDVSGFHTFERLRAADPQAKVLLCSGYSVDRQAAIILEAGAVGFLQKPFTRDSLLRELQRALRPQTADPGPQTG